MFLRKTSLILLLTFACTVVFSQNGSAPSATPSVAPPTSDVTSNPPNAPYVPPQSQGANGTVSQQIVCPQPSQLIKNGLFWGTPTGGWKSYSESFDNQIVSFIGAQWVGVNVGKMICIYKGNVVMSFPITVQNDTLAQVPSGGAWGNDQGGYRNCYSTNMLDCPFIVTTQNVNMQQVYDSLKFYKPSTNNNTNPLPPVPSILQDY